jgi:hypothetical protein
MLSGMIPLRTVDFSSVFSKLFFCWFSYPCGYALSCISLAPDIICHNSLLRQLVPARSICERGALLFRFLALLQDVIQESESSLLQIVCH